MAYGSKKAAIPAAMGVAKEVPDFRVIHGLAHKERGQADCTASPTVMKLYRFLRGVGFVGALLPMPSPEKIQNTLLISAGNAGVALCAPLFEDAANMRTPAEWAARMTLRSSSQLGSFSSVNPNDMEITSTFHTLTA
jgi:hypothetical protein